MVTKNSIVNVLVNRIKVNMTAKKIKLIQN